jgi:hypothetical protein
VHLRCVVRVESIRQDLAMSHWTSLAGGEQPRHSP